MLINKRSRLKYAYLPFPILCTRHVNKEHLFAFIRLGLLFNDEISFLACFSFYTFCRRTPHVGEFVYFAKWLQMKSRKEKKNHVNNKRKDAKRTLKCSKTWAAHCCYFLLLLFYFLFFFVIVSLIWTSKNPVSRQYGMRSDLSHLLNAIAKIEIRAENALMIGILDSWEKYAGKNNNFT